MIKSIYDVITLEDTIDNMLSGDYKERFIGEYHQLSIRLETLRNLLKKYKNNELPFDPTSHYYLLEMQAKAMEEYRRILLIRAKNEDIDLFVGM